MIWIGILYIYLFGNKILPDYQSFSRDIPGGERTYLVETQVTKSSNLIGKTIGESGLRDLTGLYMIEVQRQNKVIFVVSNDLLIEVGDLLVFAGDRSPIADLMDSNSGLTIPSVGMLHRQKHTEVVEVVISHNSYFIGKCLKDINFRRRYDAAVISIHRNEERITGKLRDV